ncbi:MAG: hypothetical protein WAW86_02810 [Gammaproteobacteria bacterium]
MNKISKWVIISLFGMIMMSGALNVYARNALPVDTGPTGSDSTMIAPINTTATPMAPIIKTGQPSAAITGGDYSSLKSCPGDPSSTTLANQAPNCPDINGRYPGALPADPVVSCPEVCMVTNYTAPDYSSAKEGVCPVGYTQIGAFNMQEEVSSNTGMSHVASNQADYDNYTSKGWNCPYAGFADGTWCVACNSTGGDTVPGGSDGAWVSSIPASGAAGRPGMVYSTSQILVIGGQKNFNKGPSGGKGTPMCSGGDPGSCSSGAANSVFRYQYYIYTCTPKPGSVHATGQYVPASKICSRIKPTWN